MFDSRVAESSTAGPVAKPYVFRDRQSSDDSWHPLDEETRLQIRRCMVSGVLGSDGTEAGATVPASAPRAPTTEELPRRGLDHPHALEQRVAKTLETPRNPRGSNGV